MARGNWTTRMVWSFEFSHVDLFFMLYLFLPRALLHSLSHVGWLSNRSHGLEHNRSCPVVERGGRLGSIHLIFLT